MHHARHLRLVLCLDRQAVPALPHGDDSLLQIAAAGIEDGIQLGVHPPLHGLHLASDLLKSGACIIRHLIFCQNAPADLICHRRQRVQLPEHLIQGVIRDLLRFLVLSVGDGPSYHIQERPGLQKLRHPQGSADLQALHGAPQILYPGEGQTALHPYPVQSVRRMPLHHPDLFQIRVRDKLPAERPPRIGGGKLCKFLDDFCIFQRAQYLRIHSNTSFRLYSIPPDA